MNGYANHGRQRDRGQALPEFALIAPIFFLLIFGVIQLGLIMASQNGLVNGVRDATRKAATFRVNELSFANSAFCTDIGDQLTSDLATSIPGFVVANLTYAIGYQWEQDPDTNQWFVVAHVEASYKNQLYVPLISFFFDAVDGVTDDRLELDATEQMRVENPALDRPADTSDQICP
jgi:Flp pilus assembly protein TadG